VVHSEQQPVTTANEATTDNACHLSYLPNYIDSWLSNISSNPCCRVFSITDESLLVALLTKKVGSDFGACVRNLRAVEMKVWDTMDLKPLNLVPSVVTLFHKRVVKSTIPSYIWMPLSYQIKWKH